LIRHLNASMRKIGLQYIDIITGSYARCSVKPVTQVSAD
jgi:hypothetical protein